MEFFVSFAASLLATVHCTTAAVLNPRADSFKLYAYGPNITAGLNVFIADGLAYVGTAIPANASDVANVTFTTDNRVSGTWEVTADNDSWNETVYWTIGDTGASLEPVGVGSSDGSNITTDFGLYGAWAYHISDDGSIEMNYRATPTDTDDLYLIEWDPSTTVDDTAILVNLRTESPVPITDKMK